MWTSALDRAGLTAAADEIDEALRRDPLAFGEARVRNTRIAFVPPLAVLFDVDEPNRTVTVWDIWNWSS
jgi:hypothetical protein